MLRDVRVPRRRFAGALGVAVLRVGALRAVALRVVPRPVLFADRLVVLRDVDERVLALRVAAARVPVRRAELLRAVVFRAVALRLVTALTPARRLRVAAPLRAAATRWLRDREAEARPPRRPPLRADVVVSGTPRPEPLLLPPPLSLLTVAQARRSASSSDTPRFS